MKANAKTKVAVLGAGVTGLSAAYRLSQFPEFEVHVFEKESMVGGLCRSFEQDDFIFDLGPHKFYSNVDGVVSEMCKIMGDDFLVRDKVQKLYMDGKYFSFPLKLSEMLTKYSPVKAAQILSSFGAQTAKNIFSKETIRTYEEFVVSRFGRSLYQNVFEPMAKKMFGEPSTLDRRLAEVRISSPGLVSVIKNAVFQKEDKKISAPSFHYPKYGFGMIPERLRTLAEKNGVKFHLGVNIKKIDQQNGRASGLQFEDREGLRQTMGFDQLIYTIPIPLIASLMPDLPTDVREACRWISYRHTVIHYFQIKSEAVLPAMWVFFPESKFRFGRLSEMTKFSPHTAPKGYTTLMVDFTCEESDPAWSMEDSELDNLLLPQLDKLKMFDRKDVVKSFSRRFRNFYPIYSVSYRERLDKIRGLESRFSNLYFIGRLGDFNYNNSDQCFDMGFAVADHLKARPETSDWQQIREDRFDQYKIVD